MPMGPGKYDDLCSDVRIKSRAAGAVVLVFGGAKGDGFSAQMSLELTLRMPELLRYLADQIEASSKQSFFTIEPK